MRVININSKQQKFPVGCQVVVVKEYYDKQIQLMIGLYGRVTGASVHSLPDYGLINIRVIEVNFGNMLLKMNEALAGEYLEQL